MDRYILDSNVFITPFQQYYPFDFAGGFWNQMKAKMNEENVILLDVVNDEICKLEDELSNWLKGIDDLHLQTIKDHEIIESYREVLTYLQNSPLYRKPDALRMWSAAGVADPWIIAAAKAMNAVIITTEARSGPISPHNPSRKPKIPNVAEYFGVPCESLFYFMRKMDFRL